MCGGLGVSDFWMETVSLSVCLSSLGSVVTGWGDVLVAGPSWEVSSSRLHRPRRGWHVVSSTPSSPRPQGSPSQQFRSKSGGVGRLWLPDWDGLGPSLVHKLDFAVGGRLSNSLLCTERQKRRWMWRDIILYIHTSVYHHYIHTDRLPRGSDGKGSACNVGDPGSIPVCWRTLEKGISTHSSFPAWRIPWAEEPGGLQSIGLQTVRHDRAANTFTFMLYMYIQIYTLIYMLIYTVYIYNVYLYTHTYLHTYIEYLYLYKLYDLEIYI